MSQQFEPGAGWRILRIDEVVDEGAEVITWATDDQYHAWVREAPVPPLPTAPYTVIRVTLEDGYVAEVMLTQRGDEGIWGTAEGMRHIWCTPSQLLKIITGFEVLSEPRAVTAKAVLTRVGQEFPGFYVAHGEVADSIAREFGVES